ncbi:hypothetical protein GCM10010471_24420 [Leucobacter komagatae]
MEVAKILERNVEDEVGSTDRRGNKFHFGSLSELLRELPRRPTDDLHRDVSLDRPNTVEVCEPHDLQDPEFREARKP